MSVTLSLTQRFTATLADGTKLDLGSLITPETIDLTNGTIFRTTDVVADNYGQDVLWTAGEGGMDTFEVILVKTDADIVLELRTTAAGLNQIAQIGVAAGPWTLITKDEAGGYVAAATKFDGAALVDGTDYDQVDRVEAYRDAADGQGDATVTIVLLS